MKLSFLKYKKSSYPFVVVCQAFCSEVIQMICVKRVVAIWLFLSFYIEQSQIQ